MMINLKFLWLNRSFKLLISIRLVSCSLETFAGSHLMYAMEKKPVMAWETVCAVRWNTTELVKWQFE